MHIMIENQTIKYWKVAYAFVDNNLRQKSYYESLQSCNRPQQGYLLLQRKQSITH